MMGVKVKRGADGVFECRLYLGRSIDGKAIRPYKRFHNAATEEEAVSYTHLTLPTNSRV